MTYVDVHAQLWHDGDWHDYTSYVRHADGIQIERGRPGETDQSGTTRMRMSLNNPELQFSSGHPESPFYRKLGQGTPVRVYVGTPHVGAGLAVVTNGTDHAAPAVTATTDNAVLMCMWGAPETGTYTLPGGMTGLGSNLSADGHTARSAWENIAATGTTGTRTATFSASEQRACCSVLLHRTSAASDPQSLFGSAGYGSKNMTLDPGAQDWIGQWVVVMTYMAWTSPYEIVPSYPESGIGSGGWILLADTGTAEVGDAQARFIRAKAWAKRLSTNHKDSIVLRSLSASSGTAGLYMSTRLVRVPDVEHWSIRATTEVATAEPRRQTATVKSVALDTHGALGVLGSSASRPFHSAMYRESMHHLRLPSIAAYWPCEESSGATHLASALPGAPRMRLRGDVSVGAYDGFGGSERAPILGATGNPSGGIPPHEAGDGIFARCLYFMPTGGATDQSALLGIRQLGGTVARYRVQYLTAGSGSLRVQSLADDDSVVAQSSTFNFGLNGSQFILRFTLVQFGGAVAWTIGIILSQSTSFVPLAGIEAVATGTFSSQTLGRATRVGIGDGGGLDGVAFGHLMVATDNAAVKLNGSAMTGYSGESPSRRIHRLCLEAGVDVVINGSEEVGFSSGGDRFGSAPMGPQRTGRLLDLLRDAERVGGGVLFDPREFVGIGYRTRPGMTNQDSAATVDGSDGQLAHWQPLPDGLLVRNDVTATRPGGSFARSVQTAGPLNINPRRDDPDGVGEQPVQIEFLTDSDDRLPDLAGWERHLGTVEEPRFDWVGLNLVREQELTGDPALVEALAALDVGDRLIVTNPPDDVPPDDLSQLAVGFSERLSGHEWAVRVRTIPESPFHIAELDHADYGVIGSDGTVRTLGEITAESTFINFTIENGYFWTTDDGSFDVMMNGERMTVVDAQTPGASTQVLEVVRSVNGVVKTHPTGSRLELFHKSYIGL